MDSASERYMDDFIDKSIDVLARGIEKKIGREMAQKVGVYAGAGSNSRFAGSGIAIAYSDFQAADVLLRDSEYDVGQHLLFSNTQMKDALALSQFQQFNYC